MSSANINSVAANCMKFNSSFLVYIGFFVLLVIGYMWGKRNGTREERIRESKSDSKKAAKSEPQPVVSEEAVSEPAKPKAAKGGKAAKGAKGGKAGKGAKGSKGGKASKGAKGGKGAKGSKKSKRKSSEESE